MVRRSPTIRWCSTRGCSWPHGDIADAARPTLAEIVRWRREHQPGGQNAGSVFVNPIPGELPAAVLIDQLGLRGFRIGGAFVSEKHANFIQATEGATAADVRAVMEHVRAAVLRAHGCRRCAARCGWSASTTCPPPTSTGVAW